LGERSREASVCGERGWAAAAAMSAFVFAWPWMPQPARATR
jgi:hypothetical protein